MPESLVQKLVTGHLVAGEAVAGQEIGLRVDQVLLTDTNGTMAWLQFEAMGFDRVKAPTVVTYADHQVYQFDARNTEDHRYLQTASRRFGAYYSKPGNGICHQVHLETFGAPGRTLLGSDSHTPLCGALGMLAIGAGGLDVACAMGGSPYYFPLPRVVQVVLTGRLQPWVAAKDVILELLRRLTVRGGFGKIFEYAGPGIAELTVPQRATIANMGAELGLTTSVFPSDEVTRGYLARLGRESDWRPLAADVGARYDDAIEIDLSAIEPLVALPGSPDHVVPVGEAEGTSIEQVLVGSCTNGSWEDMSVVAEVLRGRRVHPDVSFVLFPASQQVLETMARQGLVADLIAAGAVVSESTCGACPGIGHVPATGSRSLRAFNRNFPGRSGLKGDQVYLSSTQTACVSALRGAITDPRRLGQAPEVVFPSRFTSSTAGLIGPSPDGRDAPVVKGPNIREVPVGRPPGGEVAGPVLIKLGDKVSTDDISPSGSQVLVFRSNMPAIAEFTFRNVDPEFVARARAGGGGFIVAGQTYGQGSSREAAAVGPMFLGVRGVLAKSFARIHRANLINWGVLPLELADPADYDALAAGHQLRIADVPAGLATGSLTVEDETTGRGIAVRCSLTERERAILLAGGRLAHTRTLAESAA
ncbi:MAG TPA: aconitate hydratase [Methylomirabilota bacterium]|jgi:aconitate hydratase|nr:aconitate hydratase [Methylomirabilota bacterium]